MHGLYIEKDEAIEIIISVTAISFALALVFARPEGMMRYPLEFLIFITPLLVTVGSGFILHEMAHKLVAIYYGARARFKMWTQGLIVMLLGSVAGILFAAPGAVYIYSNKIKVSENGIISLAGPMLNLAIAGFFIMLYFIAPLDQFFSFLVGWGSDFSAYGIINGSIDVWRFGAAMNLMLALFNMIPAFPLDGSKIFRWSRLAWLFFLVLLLVVGSAVISPQIVIGWGIMLIFFTVLSRLLFG